jgi:hypothetical protein
MSSTLDQQNPAIEPDYPTIDASDLRAFHRAYMALAEEGKIDSEGGSEWAGTVARGVCRFLGREFDDSLRDYVRELLEYAVFTWTGEEELAPLAWPGSPSRGIFPDLTPDLAAVVDLSWSRPVPGANQ